MTKKHIYVLVNLLLMVLILMTGCGGPAQAKAGDTVRVHYTGKLADNTVFDASIGSEPYKFTLGQGQTISGFEQAVIGMKVGETKTVTIPADQAYGQRQEDLVFEVGRDKLSPDIDPEVGMQLTSGQGTVTIIEVSETTVKIDANHPLAGQDLTFDITLVEILKNGKSVSAVKTQLSNALANGKPSLAEFGSSTCIPCKQMKPILEQLSDEYKGRLNVIIIDIYEERELARQYNIMAMPTQVIFDKSGKEITRHMGFWAKADILQQLNKVGIE